MEDFFSLMKKVFSVITVALVTIFSLNFGRNLNIKKPEGAVVTAAVVSDVHLTNELYRKIGFLPGLLDMQKNIKPDLFICAGDCTDNGNEKNWKAFADMVMKYLPDAEKIITLGNHDTWISYDGDHDYAPAKANFLKYSNMIMGTDNKTVWYTREISGYSFIVMGQEETSVACDISDEQISWLESAMAAAAEKSRGKPIFVINHQPFNFTHIVGDNEHSNGFNSNETVEKIEKILDSYQNVIYFSGHQHYNLVAEASEKSIGFQSVEKIGSNITSVNLPSYEYGSFLTDEWGVLGQGIVMYIYEDRVELQGRNFFLADYVEDFDITINIK